MNDQPKETYAPLDAELRFTVTATIKGVTGPLEIKAQPPSGTNGGQTGRPTQCKSCGAPIVFKTTAAGKKAPYDVETGVSHFQTCPHAEQYRKS